MYDVSARNTLLLEPVFNIVPMDYLLIIDLKLLHGYLWMNMSRTSEDLQYVASGIASLDDLFGKGLPVVPDIVAYGPEDLVYPLSLRLVRNRLNAGDVCLFSTIARTQEEVRHDFIVEKLRASRFIRKKALRIIDFFSLADKMDELDDDKWNTLLSIDEQAFAPEKFNEVLAKEVHSFRSHHPDQRLVIIFESLERLVTLIGLQNTLKAEKIMLTILKEINSVGIALLYNDHITMETIEAIKAVASVFIEVRGERTGQEIYQMVRVIKPQWKNGKATWTSLY